MMSMSPGALNSTAAETYFEQHYSQDDYYTQGQTCVGQWVGKGAAELGLRGDVTREDFSALLQGIHPGDGRVLVPAATHNGQHAAGWDSVFSAPKSVSIQALVGQDHRLIQAHQEAVHRTIQEVEKFALSHQKGGQERVVSANIVGAAFNHIAARPVGKSDHGPDPQLHTHIVLLNVTKRPDGEFRRLEPIEIYRSQTYGSAVYRSELAHEVQKLGYSINVTAGNGAWELEGYSREQVMAFSQRREDIQAQMVAAGVSGPKAAQIAALNSRQTKGNYDEAALKAEWQDRAAAEGIDVNVHLQTALGRGNSTVGHNTEAPAAIDFAATHTTEREAVIDRRALETAALQHAMGQVDLDGVRKAIAGQEQSHTLIRAGRFGWQQPQGAFTTDEMLALERQNLWMVKSGIDQAQPITEPATVQKWGAANGLSPDQIKAAELSLSSRSWVTAIEGLAGSAKTTTVGAISQLAEANGYSVNGFGMTSGSVKALKSAGLQANTIASLMANSRPKQHQPQMWIVDESSLLATRPVNYVLKEAQKHGVERIVFVGDQRQHDAIEAGAPMRQFLTANMAFAELNIIRRQHDPALKQAVQLAATGLPGQALEKLQTQNRVHQITDSQKRYEAIAANFLLGHQAGQTTLVVSPGNDERRDLNQTIRNLMVAQGHIQPTGLDHSILIAKDMTKIQSKFARHYAEGDVVHFPAAQKQYGIIRDAHLSVVAVNKAANTLSLRSEDGTLTEISPARWKGAQIYQWEDRTIAQGDRLQFRTPLKLHNIANGEFATITKLDPEKATLRFDNKREIQLPLSKLRHVDHGYAVTSHSSQGATVDRVIVNADSMRSAKLINQKQLYVSISRARFDAQLFTNDADALKRSTARNPIKKAALEDVKPAALTTKLSPPQKRNTTQLSPHQTTVGMRP